MTALAQSLLDDVAAMEAWRDHQDVAVPLGELRALVAERAALLALVEQARQACNICEEPWPHHAEACSYPANVRRMQTAERERDEAQAHARELREALEEIVAVEACCGCADDVGAMKDIARAALAVAGRPPTDRGAQR